MLSPDDLFLPKQMKVHDRLESHLRLDVLAYWSIQTMKILISADIEGASGIATTRECGFPYRPVNDPQSLEDYQTGKRWLTGDINAAVEGAIEAGATEFVVHDSHGLNYLNVLLDELHPCVEVVRGMPIIFYEFDDLVEGGYDAAFLIAMHARAGEPGVISHVLDWPLIREVRVNGQPVGESQLTAALAGYHNIPTVLITGDDLVCNEVKTWSGDQIETAIVKKSLSRYAARCLPLDKARELIRAAAHRAVNRIPQIAPSRFEIPITLEVDLTDRQVAKYCSWMPSIQYNDAYTVSYTDDDFLRVFKALLAILLIAESKLNIYV
jgi:D-amino peptidase